MSLSRHAVAVARAPRTPSARASTSGGEVVGIDIGGTNIEVAVADLDGAILARTRFATLPEQGADQALQRIARAVAALTGRSLADTRRPVLAHAAVCAGVIRSDRLLMAPNLPGWEDLALADRLSAALGIQRMLVLNDVRAGALAELRLGALRDHDPGIYLSLGTGVAAALTVGGTVLAGFDGAAGEIGYMVVPGAATSAIVTPRDSHDLTLEPLVGGKALGERASVLLGEEITARALFARSDRPARRIVEQALEILGSAIANLAVFVNPRRVVVGGGMMSSADVVLPAIAERIKAIVPFPPDVVPARFTEDASLHGAIALALEHVDPSPLPSFRESAPCS